MPDHPHTPPHSLNLRGQTLDLSSPVVMGILNVTPDSFSDGGKFNDPSGALSRIEVMVSQGADIIDVGGESTRPGAEPVPVDEELSRVMPVLVAAVPRFPDTFFSIDTTKFKVAEHALEAGVHMVNDVSGLQSEPRLAELSSRYGAALILMHARGRPETMQDDPRYESVIGEIHSFFERQISLAREGGQERIILDPGIGFGKRLEHNREILSKLDKFMDLGYPLMVGASRKSMFDQLFGGRATDERVAGTLAAHYHAMLRGARIIRVHDVRQAKDSVLVYNALTS